ncbi:MAG TPA: hypothetical protein VK187_07465, partial [Geobacteraceae bacterium]|nr:hypothetical protein [Geobacteraceae bacterium]
SGVSIPERKHAISGQTVPDIHHDMPSWISSAVITVLLRLRTFRQKHIRLLARGKRHSAGWHDFPGQ